MSTPLGVACTVIRPGDVYGPGSRPWTLLPVEAIKANQFVLPAMGSGVFNPIYVENLVDGVMLAIAAPAASGEVFILSVGVGISCKEFFAQYYRFARPGTYSIAKAARTLGFEPAVDLPEGMRRTESWLREQGVV